MHKHTTYTNITCIQMLQVDRKTCGT